MVERLVGRRELESAEEVADRVRVSEVSNEVGEPTVTKSLVLPYGFTKRLCLDRTYQKHSACMDLLMCPVQKPMRL